MHIYNGELLPGKHKLANKMMTMHKQTIYNIRRIKQINDRGFQNIKVEQNILPSSKSQYNTTQIRKMQCVMNL